ncbi:hypothetical protein NL676_013153 [Syzygium grande]|nr:hypothetical protein NL676_013153 [Syzygium grande]
MPVHDMPNSLLNLLWYHLENGNVMEKSHVSNDIQLSIWIGTQGMELGRAIRGSYALYGLLVSKDVVAAGDGDRSSRPPHHLEFAFTNGASGEGQGIVRVDVARVKEYNFFTS